MFVSVNVATTTTVSALGVHDVGGSTEFGTIDRADVKPSPLLSIATKPDAHAHAHAHANVTAHSYNGHAQG